MFRSATRIACSGGLEIDGVWQCFGSAGAFELIQLHSENLGLVLMNVRPAQGTTADAPFDFWPWLLPADRSRNGHHGGAIELLPAIRHRFPGCVSDGVVSVRLVTVTPDKPVTAWAVQITEFDEGQASLCERSVDDLVCITQNAGDHYDFSDHPSTEFPAAVIAALLKPGVELAFGVTLGIFRPQSMRMLRQMADSMTDAALHHAQAERALEVTRLAEQARHFKRLAEMSARELCRSVDLACAVIAHLRALPTSYAGRDMVSHFWDELVAECRRASFFNEAIKAQVLDAVYTEFKALPTATQWAYWLLNGDTLHHMQVGEDWAETSNDPADWTMHDLEACLDSAVRSIWRQASQEAFDSA